MPRRRENVGRRTRRAERATATRGRVQLVYIHEWGSVLNLVVSINITCHETEFEVSESTVLVV
jgi:hypothetical protein